jgi:CheY-like chemotaxis protein
MEYAIVNSLIAMNTPQTILIIEDSALLRVVAREAMEAGGFRVTEAENGKIGLDLALKEHPDLIMLDLLMPVMDGVTMYTLLREDPWGKGVYVVVLTGIKDDQISDTMKNDPNLSYLSKEHWMMDDVVAKISAELGVKDVVNQVKNVLLAPPSHTNY